MNFFKKCLTSKKIKIILFTLLYFTLLYFTLLYFWGLMKKFFFLAIFLSLGLSVSLPVKAETTLQRKVAAIRKLRDWLTKPKAPAVKPRPSKLSRLADMAVIGSTGLIAAEAFAQAPESEKNKYRCEKYYDEEIGSYSDEFLTCEKIK